MSLEQCGEVRSDEGRSVLEYKWERSPGADRSRELVIGERTSGLPSSTSGTRCGGRRRKAVAETVDGQECRHVSAGRSVTSAPLD